MDLGDLVTSAVVLFGAIGVFAYVALFLVAFFDSLIVAGTFTNGAIFLLLAGVMAASGTHEFSIMAIAAALGAILGGLVSYYIGFAGAQFFLKERLSQTNHRRSSLELIRQYGGPGVFIGRFLGPVSSIVAFMAGAVKMPRHTFIFWNLLAGVSWGVGYVTIGVTFGEVVLDFLA